MRLLPIFLASTGLAALGAAAPCNGGLHDPLANITDATPPLDALAALQKAAMRNLKLDDRKITRQGSNCTLKTAAVRKDWAKLSTDERKDFIRATQCLRSKPSIADPNFAQAAKTRYDDLTAVHVNLTNFIHATGSFLTWHRYFIWTFENALRTECEYKGYLPYWNWFAHVDDYTKSPLFDGSETSIGGDGAFYQHNGSASFFGLLPFPSGKGGGCIAIGPFKDMQATIGPINAGMRGMEPPVASMNITNPRCVRRDLNSYVATRHFTTPNLLNLTIGTASRTIELFQNEFNGRPQDGGFAGLHSAGHYTLNGENTDFYTSPNDPAFYFHHAMIDYVWWIWQALHPAEAREVAGVRTLQNTPPLGESTSADALVMGVNGETRSISDLMVTMDGTPGCYVYE